MERNLEQEMDELKQQLGEIKELLTKLSIGETGSGSFCTYSSILNRECEPDQRAATLRKRRIHCGPAKRERALLQ